MALSEEEQREVQVGLAKVSRRLHRPFPRNEDRHSCTWCRGPWPCRAAEWAEQVLGPEVDR